MSGIGIGIGVGINFASRSRRRGWSPGDAGASLLSWARGDDPGATINTTPDPDQYAAIPDRGSLEGQYEQATSANQPQVSTLGSLACPFFDAANSERFGSSLGAGSFARCHNGTQSCTQYVRFRPVNVSANADIVGTSNASASSTGYFLRQTNAGALLATYRNGSGSVALDVQSASGVLEDDVTATACIVKEGANVSLYLDGGGSGVLLGSGTIASPSASDPLRPMGIGLGATFFGGHVCEYLLFDEAHDETMRATVLGYLARWM